MVKDEELNGIPKENNQQESETSELSVSGTDTVEHVRYLSGLYKDWFLDYASYVILERAVPYLNDGLKPVQRRLLHSLRELDDGRYHKVANLIGHTMKYHPHGDASIGDALVQLGQKELLIDTQGNWGNIHTGDSAAAPRYIEARLTKFALEVVFNPKTTAWKLSYDGRNKEPIHLPVKFPLLLAQGVEGIAVGLASKILPHNFLELIDASIAYLQGKEPDILPDFPTGGMIDVSNYNNGLRGGRVRVRAKISQLDKKALVITEIPFGLTTTSLIETILAANDKEKIKIKKIDDNTAENVEIIIHLAPGVSPDKTIDALYAFTNCEISISPNSCVILDDKPVFFGVNELLKVSVQKTVELLKLELEIRKAELEESLLFASLEKIFIENRIYRNIEECETWEAVIDTIDKGLEPFKPLFYRVITTDDIVKLTEIRIKRISKFDAFKADELMKGLQEEINEVINHLNHLIDYSINYYKQIKKKYGKDRERRTEIRNFDTIVASKVAVANEKLYVNREEGFAGYGLKKDEYICDCSDIDDVIVFRENGTYMVTKVLEKFYVGKNVIHIDVFKKNDKRTIYNAVYLDGPNGAAMVKRFDVSSITRDREYNLTKETAGSKVIYFSANPNGEAEIITVHHKLRPRLKKLTFEFSFADITIKNRASQGNTLTKLPVRKIAVKEAGMSTLGGRKIWFDESVRRLNNNEYGIYLGEFTGDDCILTISASGNYMLYSYDLSNHFEDDLLVIQKFREGQEITIIYWDEEQKNYFVKRFEAERFATNKDVLIISEAEGSKIANVILHPNPEIELVYSKKNKPEKEPEIINLDEFIPVKGIKAKGKRLTSLIVSKINVIEPPVIEEELEEPDKEIRLESELNKETGPSIANENGQMTLPLL